MSTEKIRIVFSQLPWIRSWILKLLKFLQRDITIKNPYTKDDLFLNLYRHKNYWYFGKDRERATMIRFSQLVSIGSSVIEIGGHIGYISQYFSMLVGKAGSVTVFEPGSNNIRYISKNVELLNNVCLVEKAISDKTGHAMFYEDNITGQNNSLLDNFKGAEYVALSQGLVLKRNERIVEVISLDDYLESVHGTCDFIKIDIEGFEFFALQGMSRSIGRCKALMVEVTSNQEEISIFLKNNNFTLQDPEGRILMNIPLNYYGNIFALRN
jgi:FkbM family methyltransferase